MTRRSVYDGLYFLDASFDAVCANFGILHLARPDQFLSEALRVLRPGGRLAFTVRASRYRPLRIPMIVEPMLQESTVIVSYVASNICQASGDLAEQFLPDIM